MLAWVTPDYVVPGWPAVARSLLKLNPTWILLTTARVLVALLLSFVLGFGLAVAMFLWKRVDDYGMPAIRILMAVPVICWILFAVLWFRGVEFRIAFVLIAVCGPIFVVDLLDGMRAIRQELKDMVRSMRPTRAQYFTKLIAPAVLSSILTSWKVNLSLAIRVVTIAELVGATSGIGYGLVVAQGLFSIADIFAWTLVLVLILLAGQQVVEVVERRCLRWRGA